MMGSWLRRIILDGVTARATSAVLGALLPRTATILMLHRFRDDTRGVSGHDPAALRRLLARLRCDRYDLLPLEEIFAHLSDPDRPAAPAVAFTLDDGYTDQADVAGPVFAEFDCPATVFVTTGFLDARLWLWWDQIEFVLETTTRPRVSLALPGGSWDWSLDPPGSRSAAVADFMEVCKTVSDHAKHELIRALAEAADVDIPRQPPDRYAPMSWAQLRGLETRGLSFGPHTVTHPILSKADDAQASYEIIESWRRLQTESQRPLPVFCYPNGQLADFGEREVRTLTELGFMGALTGVAGYASDEPRFRVPRFAYQEDLGHTLQYVNGFERLKQRLRMSR